MERALEAVSSDLQNQLQEVIGPAYRIDSELGGAGMSRVFVATELELDRQVVVKVLPPELSASVNTDRFRREIQLAARLQHPHIVNLLAAGAKGSLLYYTMPFIGGENLRTRLNRSGELPVQEATRILREVADALSYAHSQGVVHRDIKPENILISGNHALVTDFGVSKALSSATSETPKDTQALTSLGIALGTPAYMAPEQAAADPMVDARADIYALGIVGYELLSGRTPFAGLNQQQTLAAHITTAPAPITQQRPQLLPGLAAVIMRCIEKRPADRFQSADELHAALEPYAMTSGATAPTHAALAQPFQWTPQRIAVAAGILGIVAAGFIVSTIAFRRTNDTPIVGNTKQVTNAAGLEIIPTISPDGRLITYSVSDGNSYKLYVKQLSGGRAIMLADTGAFASWKPDGSDVLYSKRPGVNYTVPALGGVSTLVPGLAGVGACMYSNAGDRVACTNVSDGTLVIADASGEKRRTVSGTAGGDGVMMPTWSADDRMIAFSLGNSLFFIGENIGNLAPSSIWVVRADAGNPVKISDNSHLNVSPVWTPEGAVLFISSLGGNRDIYMQRLASDLSPKGEPVRLTTGLNAHTISVDRAGKTLAYSVFNTMANVWAAPIAGSTENPRLRQVTTGNQTIESSSISPDGRWLAYDSNINGNSDIFKMPVAGGEAQQLTHNGVDNFSPAWSRDGTQIAFHSLVKGNRDIYVMDVEGGNVTPVVATPSESLAPLWRGDGKGLIYRALPDSMFEVLRDASRPTGWGLPKFRGRIPNAAFSPDGKQLLAVSEKGGLCGNCVEGPYVLSSDWSGQRMIPLPEHHKIVASPGYITWSTDSKYGYLQMREVDGTSSIWQLPVNGDPGKRVLHLTDPGRQFYRTNLGVDNSNFYFPLGDRQSDVWTMELKKQ